ncbi:MAG: UDP-2,3-diacylglucosamine diphosphatase [Planctomycetes bacterium]|nr:UDP-2,3-diacylglucosamine diphosphatase [Planctomycetota bacterium]
MTGEVWIASDLHLDPSRPDRTRAFVRFVALARARAIGLYLLGDLFNYWIGPAHARLPDHREALDALASAVRAGFPVAFLPGNRDFLAGMGRPPAGMRLLPDRASVRLFGRSVLLMHGDLLCTDDRRYQRWRRVARSPLLRGLARALPARAARALAERMRAKSQMEIARKLPASMDLTARGIQSAFSCGADVVVCGHVHRQEARDVPLGGGRTGRLYVLPSWEGDAPYLRVTEGGFEYART